MNTRKLTLPALLDALADGWESAATALVEEFLLRWKTALKCSSSGERVSRNTLQCVLDLGEIRLRGMSEVQCLVMGGEEMPAAAQAFVVEATRPGRVALILGLSKAAYECSRTTCVGRFAILDRDCVQALLEAPNPRLCLKRHLWEQIPRRALIPYSIVLPAEENMFFGRRLELDRLMQEEHVSFALAGPGRIGKTSLAKRFEGELRQTRDPRAQRKFALNLGGCGSLSSNALARYIAMQIDPSHRSDRVTTHDLLDFLRHQRHKLGGPLELLLDEVDEVYGSDVLDILGAAARAPREPAEAKERICRLVLCGRGVLLRAILTEKRSLACRMEVLRLAPLDEAAARELLLSPLEDLGFAVSEPARILDFIFRFTGRMPHLLQYYGLQLVELAIRSGEKAITPALTELVKWDFETAQFLCSALLQIAEPDRRLIALELVKRNAGLVTIPLVRQVAMENGIPMEHLAALQLMNELVIDQVLRWDNGAYAIANESLVDYANRLGFLDGACVDARRAIEATRQDALLRRES